MTLPRITSIRFIVILCGFTLPALAWAGDKPTLSAPENPQALFDRMAHFISSAPRFQTTVRMGFDVIQDTGQKIEFSERHRITIARPARLRAEIVKSNGEEGVILFDGQKITAYSATQGVYAQSEKQGSIDEVLVYFLRDLQMRLPLALMFRSDFPEEMQKRLVALAFVEISAVTDTPCVHLAGRTDEIDFQVWIPETGDPLPRRLTLTYRDEQGQPKFWADFENWNLRPAIADADFAFTPPADAERIPFLVEIENALGEEKTKGEN